MVRSDHRGKQVRHASAVTALGAQPAALQRGLTKDAV